MAGEKVTNTKCSGNRACDTMFCGFVRVGVETGSAPKGET